MPSVRQFADQIPPLWLCAWAQVAWVLGCALQLTQGALWPGASYATGTLLAAVAVLLAQGPARRGGAGWQTAGRLLVLALTLAALGFASTGWRAAHFARGALAPQVQGQDVQLQGVVVSLPQPTQQGQRWQMVVEQAWWPDGQAVQLPRRVALNSYTPELQVQPGQRWRLTVRLQRPHGARNPHGFDVELWWWNQGVQATGYVRPQGVAELLEHTWQAPLEQARAWVRSRLRASLEQSPSAQQQRALGVVTALITGEQAAIAKDDWRLFRDTGVAHLVSISGLHITMFAWLAMALVGALWRRSPALCLRWPAPMAAAWAGLVLAWLYALFSGWGIPAQRTLLMLLTVVLLRTLGLHWHWPRVWLLVLTVVVAWEPWALLQAGFWLSFVAVGVLFMTDPGPRRSGWWQPAWRLLREQALVGLALAPLTLLLFGQISVVGFVANLWAIPWVTLLLTPLAMLGVLCAPLWLLAAWCASVLLVGLEWMAQWPLAVAYFAQPPLWLGMAGVLGCVWLLMRWPWPLRLLGLPLVLPMLLWQPRPPAPGEFTLLTLDVGQGGSVLVQTAHHALLVDAGPRWATGDAGQQNIVPLLRAYGLRLDRVLLTHADSDHTGGALAVLQAQAGAELWGSGIASMAAQAQRPWQPCRRGQQWQWDGVIFTVLWPVVAQGESRNTNASSCVLLVRAASGASALLTGDIEQYQERALLELAETPSELRADALLVAHHGSKSSTSALWLQAVQPQVALVQSGWRNRFGHPAASVVQRLHNAQARLFNTATCGAIHWQSTQPQTAQCERQLRPRYWQSVQP